MDEKNKVVAEEPGVGETQMEECQHITEELLVILGEAWSRIEELETQSKKLNLGKQSVKQAPQPLESKPGSGVIILDDSKLMQARLRDTIEPLGFEVIGTAENGETGAELVVKKNPKLVILDHQMPIMDGLQCLQAFRLQCPNVRVIVCTGEITEELSQKYAQFGVSAIITKPIQIIRFVTAVRKCMSFDPAKEDQELENLVDSL